MASSNLSRIKKLIRLSAYVLFSTLAPLAEADAQDVLPVQQGGGQGGGRAVESTTPSGPVVLGGRVVRPTGEDVAPIRNSWAVLHRIGSDSVGAIDSMRTSAEGRFRFRFSPTGAQDAVYFVSSSYSGIAYFSDFRSADIADTTESDILVFDTTSAPVSIKVVGRHLIIFAPDGGPSRRVVEVYELSNDSMLTRVIGRPGDSVWDAIVPTGAGEFRVGPAGVSQDALELREGRIRLSAPFAPGLKQISFAYTLGADEFPLALPIDHGATVLEVLLEEVNADVSGAGLVAVNPVSIEGRNFKRYLAQEVADDAVIIVNVSSVGGLGSGGAVTLILLTVGVAMLVALTVSFRRRAAAPSIAVPLQQEDPEAEALARAIADLDVEFAAVAEPSAEQRESYMGKRGELKSQLTQMLRR